MIWVGQIARLRLDKDHLCFNRHVNGILSVLGCSCGAFLLDDMESISNCGSTCSSTPSTTQQACPVDQSNQLAKPEPISASASCPGSAARGLEQEEEEPDCPPETPHFPLLHHRANSCDMNTQADVMPAGLCPISGRKPEERSAVLGDHRQDEGAEASLDRGGVPGSEQAGPSLWVNICSPSLDSTGTGGCAPAVQETMPEGEVNLKRRLCLPAI